MRLIALVLLTTALAGCFGGGSGGDGNDRDGSDGTSTDTGTGGTTGGPTGTSDPPPDDGRPVTRRIPMLLGFGWEGCSGAEVLYHPEVETAQATLPAGYTAHGEAPATGGDAVASVQYLWTRCETFSASTTTINNTIYGHVAVRIEDPGNATADTHWYRLRMLTTDGTMQQLWTAAGYDVYAATYNRTAQGAGPLQVRTETLGDYALEGPDLTPGETGGGAVAYWTETGGGLLEWTGAVDVGVRATQGSFSVPEGDPFSEAIAAQTAPDMEMWFHDGSTFQENELHLLRTS